LELFLPLISGGQVEVAPTSELRDGFALRRRLERSGATVVQATPATWTMLIEAGWTGHRSLKVLCGGEALTPTLAEGLLTRARDVWNVYGPTETTIWSSFDRLRAGHPITIGRPIANTQFYVVDAKGHPVPMGVPGELWIGGDGVARGYLRRPELTTDKFVADPFVSADTELYKTGDLVRRLTDGRIEWLERLDNQVKIRGFRIELGEIESVLTADAAVRQAAVLVQEDAAGEKRLVAYLTAREGRTLKDSELRDLLRKKLPEYMIPSAFVVLERFPLTPNGKVDRKALPRRDVRALDTGGLAAPVTETQKALSDIWRHALGLERLGLHDNFFELGGHSLLAVRVIAEIDRTLNIHVSVPQFFQNAAAARVLKDKGRVDVLVCNAGIARSETPAEDLTDEHWLNVIDVNLNGLFWCCRAFGRPMLAAGRGSIVNIGSMSGYIVNKPQPQAQYNASKAGVHHLTKSLAAEWAPRGVRVNAVAPTYINTPMTVYAKQNKTMFDTWMDYTPMARMGEVDEIAAVVLFLASDAASLMAGSIVVADGGYTCW
jgi:NAD(P)-dependent dehydrogenase (short-subunit alcohol dehydrogenase family)